MKNAKVILVLSVLFMGVNVSWGQAENISNGHYVYIHSNNIETGEIQISSRELMDLVDSVYREPPTLIENFQIKEFKVKIPGLSTRTILLDDAGKILKEESFKSKVGDEIAVFDLQLRDNSESIEPIFIKVIE